VRSAAVRFTRSSAYDWRTRSEVAPRDGDIDCLVRDMHKPELAPASGILPEQISSHGRPKNFRSEEQPIKREGVLVKGALSQPTGEPPLKEARYKLRRACDGFRSSSYEAVVLPL
jgi:hypothetical protein